MYKGKQYQLMVKERPFHQLQLANQNLKLGAASPRRKLKAHEEELEIKQAY